MWSKTRSARFHEVDVNKENTLKSRIISSLMALTLTPVLAFAEPYESRYQPLPSETLLLKGGTILTGTGEQIDSGDVLIKDGKIARVGKNLKAKGAKVVELNGAWVTPGIIDVHSHLGAGGQPRVRAHSDINEATAPTTPDVWIEHSVATGSGVRNGLGRWYYHPANPAGIGQLNWWPKCHTEERTCAHRCRDEVSGCALWFEDGLWREPQARLRWQGSRSLNPNG